LDTRTTTFQQLRSRLYGIAYRMLASRSDAEDMLQEAYLRWHRTDIDQVQIPEAWLVTTITRLCIDRLRALRNEREAYAGPWLPEPLVDEAVAPPDRQAELASDLSVAFLVVLERLAPEERAAFLLHDVFDCDYGEIAQILGKGQANCRQIVHRARTRVRQERPRFQVSEAARRRLLERFIGAIHAQDRETLLALFSEDATWTADGGGKVSAAPEAVRGAANIAELIGGIARRIAEEYQGRARFRLATLNGETGIVACLDGRPVWALSIDTDGVRIRAGYNVLNPDKLGPLAPADFCGE
jgi:RNA polymerase sigma-70 factor (ECF subfamily)